MKACLGITVAALLMVPAPSGAQQAGGEREIEQVIRANYQYARENLVDAPDTNSSEGAGEFWSSGGLLQDIPPDAPPVEYDSFSLTPKHISVTMLAEGAAVSHYYLEGGFKVRGEPAITDYLTRVTQVFVREDGTWKVRASHYSPVRGGSGTAHRAPEH